jgi:5'-3' exoribonuclease 2
MDIPMSSLWQGRLDHLSKAVIVHFSKAGYIPKLSFSDHQFCEHCPYGKQVAVPHLTTTPRESSPLDLVYSDICGPMPQQSLGGSSYFVTFIDDATRKVWAYPTWRKDRVFTIFKDWLAIVENQTDRKLKCLRSDNGGEYNSDEFAQFLPRMQHQTRIYGSLQSGAEWSRRTDESDDPRTDRFHAAPFRTFGGLLG